MDGFVDIGKIANIVFLPDKLRRIFQEPLHFGLCAAVTELKVVEHGVVLLGKSLIRRLNRGHIRSHFVCIIGHVSDCHVCIFRDLFRVATKRL